MPKFWRIPIRLPDGRERWRIVEARDETEAIIETERAFPDATILREEMTP